MNLEHSCFPKTQVHHHWAFSWIPTSEAVASYLLRDVNLHEGGFSLPPRIPIELLAGVSLALAEP
jgi:hypothetical protein